MKDFLINLIVIIFVLISYYYFKNKINKSITKTDEQDIILKYSKVMIIFFLMHWVFTLIITLINYDENIIINLVISTILTAIILLIFYKKSKNKIIYTKFDLIKISVIIILILMNFSTITNKTQFISKGDSISVEQIEIGDILFLHVGLADSLLPGYWSHIGLVINKANDTLYVAESTTKGVHALTLGEFIDGGRISVAKPIDTSTESKQIVANYVKSKIGLSYDFNIFTKQVDNNKYYCSELIWAAYQQIGLDIDSKPGFFIKSFFAVAPQEIFMDEDLIVYHINKTLKSKLEE